MREQILVVVTTRETGRAATYAHPCREMRQARAAYVEECDARSLGNPGCQLDDWAVSVVMDGREVMSAGSGAG